MDGGVESADLGYDEIYTILTCSQPLTARQLDPVQQKDKEKELKGKNRRVSHPVRVLAP